MLWMFEVAGSRGPLHPAISQAERLMHSICSPRMDSCRCWVERSDRIIGDQAVSYNFTALSTEDEAYWIDMSLGCPGGLSCRMWMRYNDSTRVLYTD